MDSDDFSALSGGWTDGDGSAFTVIDEVGWTSAGNWASTSGERCSITILLFFAVFDVDFVVVVVDDMVGDGTFDGWSGGVVDVDDGDACLAESPRCAREEPSYVFSSAQPKPSLGRLGLAC